MNTWVEKSAFTGVKLYFKSDMVIHACNLSTWGEAQEERFQKFENSLEVQSEQANRGYVARLFQREERGVEWRNETY